MNSFKRPYWFILLMLGLVSVGCQPEVVPPSGNHAPTDPQTVKIYQKAPQKYEQLGTITVPINGEVKFDDKGDSKVGFQMLREQAAAKGANGVLLAADPGMSDISVTVGDGTNYYQVPVRANPHQVVAQAIYVLNP